MCPGIERHRLAPFKPAPRGQPRRTAEDNQQDVDATSFVLIVDDDPDLQALLRVVERYVRGPQDAGA